ncbi:unnamed protein product [Oppiella nova]|uniref:Uncharacterized protein n=1 Tax=Oppiella nova TaxID=334625 RepID=A0A7R9M4Q2_9ACAR|nr:unnamed protein product [Oppiella nova]CAG2170229.1 unnamed protein product [Oppiella nova]
MRAPIVLLSVLIGSALSIPLGQLFDPFGAFLQGEILNTNQDFHESSDYFSSMSETFAAALEDEEVLAKKFAEFQTKFQKSYATEEESEKRILIFKENALKVFEHNVKAATGRSSYTQHISQFADMTTDEIIAGVTGYFPQQEYRQHNASQQNAANSQSRVGKDSWIYDWRSTHVVTPVQNQGGCGACVYFAAAALIETAWARHGHEAVVLSPQQLNDCAHDEARGNHGCEHGGGTFVPTFDYIKAHGLTSMQNYPYIAKDANCDHNKESQVVARINSWTPITPHGNEEVLRQTIEKNGPAAVAIHVSDGWTKYKQGVFDEPCAGGRNHAVLAVGYGYDGPSNKDYWIVKNQWGTGFGDNGYILMRRNNNNMCDIAGDAVWVD